MSANPERILKLILQITGGIMVMAIVAVFLPLDQMANIHQWLNLEKTEFPKTGIVDYLARSLSAFYVLMGMLYIVLARDIRVYAPVVAFVAWANIFFGLVTIWIDVRIKFPLWWTLGEGPFIVLFGVLILWLQRKVRKTPAEADDGMG